MVGEKSIAAKNKFKKKGCSVLRIAILHQVSVQPVQDATEQAQDESVGEAG